MAGYFGSKKGSKQKLGIGQVDMLTTRLQQLFVHVLHSLNRMPSGYEI
jgi:hypothetical protein